MISYHANNTSHKAIKKNHAFFESNAILQFTNLQITNRFGESCLLFDFSDFFKRKTGSYFLFDMIEFEKKNLSHPLMSFPLIPISSEGVVLSKNIDSIDPTTQQL